MTDRERFLRCILGDPVDRPPYWLFWEPWKTTWDRWEQEGKPSHVTDHRSVFGPDRLPETVPVNYGPCPKIEKKIIEEDDDFVVFTDTWGIKRRDYKHGVSMPEFLEFPVKDRKDWEKFREEKLDPDDPSRLEGDWRERCTQWTEEGVPIQLGGFPDVGLFGAYRWLVGDEDGLLAFCTMPDLVHEIMDHLTSVYLTVFENVVKEVRVDVVHFFEDMCARQGPLISPAYWDEFMGPGYRRVREFTVRHGIPLLSVDTDGNPDLIAPPMMGAGVNFLYPMEVAAGCDVNAWQRKYPALGMMGGIDKRALASGPAAIDKELERIRPAVESGRYIPDLDHLVPDNVSWDNYSYYAETLKALVEKS